MGEYCGTNMMLTKYLIKFAKAVIPIQYHGKAAEIYQDRDSIMRAAPFIGIKFFCPCCGWYLRKFLPFGVKLRPNALCPRCHSLERHRLLWLYLKDSTNLFTDHLRVLHFAPEHLFNRAFKSLDNLDYTTADLDPNRAMIEMDITNITYEDNSFDVILCSHVLEHVMDDKKAMSELFRVLSPGGWAILQVPVLREKTYEDPAVVAPEERERLFGQRDHVRIYGLDYRDRLESAGFNVKVDGYVRKLGSAKIRRYGLSKGEDIYFCTKPC